MSTQLDERTTVGTQTEQESKKKSTTVGTLLVIALLLILLTFVILASRLYDMATRDKYAVDLGVGTDGEIELFQIEYENTSGQLTVQGLNGENVVAPGTTVDYDIRLRNRDDVIIDFTMCPKADYLNDDPVPIVIKLVDNFGNYVLGSEYEWVSVDELNTVTHFGAIHPDEIYTYHLTWMWSFENGIDGDRYDTYLGNQNGQFLPGVEVSINAEASASAITFQHIFGCCWCCYVVWLLVLIILALLLWICYLLRKLKKQKELLEEYETSINNIELPGENELV